MLIHIRGVFFENLELIGSGTIWWTRTIYKSTGESILLEQDLQQSITICLQ